MTENSATYPAEITLGNLCAGGAVGTSSYTTFPCSGNLSVISTDGAADSVVLNELIGAGADVCTNGTITLTYNSGSDTVTYDWFQTSEPAFTASGTLTRA